MKLIEIVEGVNKFFIDKDELIWRNDKVQLNRETLYEGSVVLISLNKDLILVQTENSGAIVFDREDGDQFMVDKPGMILSKSLLLVGKWNDDYSKRLIYGWNFRKNIMVWESDSYFGNSCVVDGNLLGSLRSILFRIDSNSGLPVWQCDLYEKFSLSPINKDDKPIDVKEFIGIQNNCLYFKAGTNLILGVELNSGNKVFSYEYLGKNVLLDNLRLDSNKGVIFSIGSQEYFELDLVSHKVAIFSLKEKVQEANVEPARLGSWDGNLIYFWEGGANPKFGVFDRNSKTINVIQNLDSSGYPAIKDVKHGQGKIYVLDGNNNLHLFQE